MKKLSVTCVILILIATLTSCLHRTSNDRNIKTIVTNAEFGIIYDGLDKMIADSQFIIEGDVTDTSYFDFNTITYTKSHVKVTKILYGNINKGDVLTFTEAGGITTQAAVIKSSGADRKFGTKTTEKDKSTKVKYLFCGSETMKQNDKVLLFGVEDDFGYVPPGEKYYLPIGDFQGKFYIKGSKVERNTGNSFKDHKSYLSLNKNKTQLEKEIKEIINTKQKQH